MLAEFPGFDMSLEDCELNAVKFISPKLLAREVELMHKKWFDYRFMHPTMATMYFAECYRNAFKMISMVRYDASRGQYMKGLAGDKDGNIFLMKQIEITGLWAARQAADALCIPYDFYCNEAMRLAERNMWKHMPRPQRMYSDEMQCDIHNAWMEEQAINPRLAAHKAYNEGINTNSIAVNEYLDYLVSIAQQREKPEYFLARMLQEGMPLADKIEATFGKHVAHTVQGEKFNQIDNSVVS